MKKVLIVFSFIAILVVAYLSSQSNKKIVSFSNYKILNYQLEGKNLRLLIADNQQKREKGLMNVKKMDKGIAGMIFIFPVNDYQTFWNKNTWLNLDLYWINNDKVVGKDFLPAVKEDGKTTVISSPQTVDRVIEIPR